MQKPTLPLSALFAAFFLVVACDTTKPSTPTQKNEGEVCSRDDECKTGLCEAIAGTQTSCVRKCADGCLANEICEQLTPGRFSCAKDRGGLCTQCVLDSDCPYPADKCLVVDGKGVCGRDCAFNQNCPTSYRCLQGIGTDGKAKSQQCTPASGSCTCTSTTAGQMISCENKNSSGTCGGFRTCDGLTGFNTCTARVPEPELCNGIDDDCDGKTDENSMPLSCGVGACATTIDSCVDGGVRTCTPLPKGIETCNGIDDDCDGTADNGPFLANDKLNCGQCGKVCTLPNTSQKCSNSTCVVDVCAQDFDNCNRRDDDGCEVNLQSDKNNCGGCNTVCSAPGSSATCVSGVCQYQCAPGFIDLDGLSANGCEFACTPVAGVDLPDVDMIDSNCDGFEGEVSMGIFVSDGTGDDTNSGTMASPVQTIAKGVALAKLNNKPNIYVARPLSSYTGPLDLTNVTGKLIAGGYEVASPKWRRSANNTTLVYGGNPALLMSGSNNTIVQHLNFRSDDATGVDSNGSGNSAYAAAIVNTTGAKLQKVTLQSGKGAPGSTGAAGTPAAPTTLAANGGFGGPPIEDESNDVFCSGEHPGEPLAGRGGTSACGRTGGWGGRPGFRHDWGLAGDAGIVATPGGPGGQAEAYASTGLGLKGTDGAAGLTGTPGARSAMLGTLSASGYLPPIGGWGDIGGNGHGGGGGGGGGGGCLWKASGFQCCTAFGGAGGGGGAGGCGGSGAGPGGSGGASIALGMWQSTGSFIAVTLRPGNGGNGGQGGNGGSGSAGGQGGTALAWLGGGDFSAGIGGVGGNGGQGGQGGGGAGGAGGSVFAYVHDSTSVVNTTALILGSPGTAGSGGAGGNGSTSAGPDGQFFPDKSF